MAPNSIDARVESPGLNSDEDLKIAALRNVARQDLLPQMHVLTLTPFYPTAEDDASGCFIAESVGELQRQGVASSVIAVHPMHRSHPGSDPKAPPATWKKYFCLPGNPGLSSAGQFLHAALKFHVRQLHAQKQINLVHAHAALPCGQAAMLLAKDLGIPFVVTVHGLDAFSTRQVPGWFGRRCSEVSEDVYGAAARVICISEQVARRVREGMGGAANISVVYNGVDSKLFSPKFSANSSPEFSPPGDAASADSVILSVGNLIPIKGHELLLRSVAAVTPAHPQVRCRIIGDGSERVRLQELAQELRIADRVHFLGRRPRSEVAAAMRECALFALPSFYEGLGGVYLEAMSTERPAVACRGQGIEEVIRHGENGWLIEPKNLNDLTNTLQILLSDWPLREKLGRNGRQTILQGYTLAHQATELLSIYRECLR
jgi:teichuronic acid biosynthesis glycosyltransferase TuaC